MTSTQPLTITQLAGLFNMESLYFLSYSWLLGQAIWVSFFGGIIAHKVLPRQQFTVLQSKTFPVYFTISMTTASFLLAVWISNDRQVLHHLSEPLLPAVAQTWTLGFVVLLILVNWVWVGPVTNELAIVRLKQERAEGKPYYDANVSQQMKAINKRFGTYHGVASLVNLFVVIALLFHGLWIANVGLKKTW